MMLGGVVAIGAIVMALGAVLTAVPASINSIILLVGADESQRVVNWYATANNNNQLVQLAPTSALLPNGDFPASATTYSAVVALISPTEASTATPSRRLPAEHRAFYRVGEVGAFLRRNIQDALLRGDSTLLFSVTRRSARRVTQRKTGWLLIRSMSLSAPIPSCWSQAATQVETANTESQ
jgi:hypothetical protein